MSTTDDPRNDHYFTSPERIQRHLPGPDDVDYGSSRHWGLPVPADAFRPGEWVDDDPREGPHWRWTPTGTEGGEFHLDTIVPSADTRGQPGRSIHDPEGGH
ncbi:hypothetical protein B5M43_010210 [Microbacterium sp. MEC084]|uniref:hypothetical protein n=1 Tax=unclassified Microbacterium TaxID=2609290 RepID=UPI0006FF1E48|nr:MULTISPECIES: hypothetical protein [unclassified Microbacterium]KQY98635.1 hypothetical protein ASD19_07345 [Microbacterium sp. Root53]MCD1269207.1 hypothetical protein [Microbacterium sp. MEC084]